MPQFLNKVVLDNTIENYLIVFASILFAFIVKRFISKYFARILYKVFAKKGKVLHKEAFVNLIIPPLELFLLIFISFVAFDKLNFPKDLDFKIYKITLRLLLDSLSNAVMVWVFIWLCLRVIDFAAMVLEEKASQTADLTDNQLIVFFKDFFKVLLVIVGVLLVLRFSFNKNIGNLLTGLSIAGAAIALSLRESLENLIASFIIFFDKPFITGDTVKVQSFTGTIEKIGLRSTRIRTDSKTYLSVPNKQMVDTIIDNITLRTQRKTELRIELSIATTPDQLKHFLFAVRKEMEDEPAIEKYNVYLMDTGKNAHVVAADYFSTMPQDMEDYYALREKINLRVIDIMAQQQLQLAAANTEIIVTSK
jgi:MscS family membrane protein